LHTSANPEVANVKSFAQNGAGAHAPARALRISDELSLPAEAASTLVIYGGKGMGKTNLGSVLVEELSKAGLKWAVLDPLGVWWGLRHSADLRRAGIDCLLVGGMHGDLPLEPGAGRIVADMVAEEHVNVVVDFSRSRDGRPWEKNAKIAFATDYALQLFQRQGEISAGVARPAMMQILDEAGRYVPQTIPHGSPELARSVGAWEQMVEEGRNLGLGVTLLTQRSARLNKSVAELADAMIAFRTVGPNSIQAVLDWLGEHIEKARWKEMTSTLRALPIGRALVVSPGWLQFEGVVQIRARETFDSSATPKGGERRGEPATRTPPDLDKYRARMAETIERAIADDPTALRSRIADLERQLGTKAAPAVDHNAIELAVNRAITDERNRWLGLAPGLAADLGCSISQRLANTWLEVEVCNAFGRMANSSGPSPAPESAPASLPAPEAAMPTRDRRVADSPHASIEVMTDKQRALLTALAQYEREGPLDSASVTALTGMRGGTLYQAIADCRRAGTVEGPNAALAITHRGFTALGRYEALPTGRELIQLWRGRLSKARLRIFDALIERPGRAPISHGELTEWLDIRGGSMFDALAFLRRCKLIEGPNGSLRASARLLP
jgi:uncharacterized protein